MKSNKFRDLAISSLALFLLCFSVMSLGCNIEPPNVTIDVICKDTYAIHENGEKYNNSYLIIGSTRALLFDTGNIINSATMKATVASLTKLPVIVTFSHTHYDHIKYLQDFDNVVLPEIEPLMKYYSAKDQTFTPAFLMYGLSPLPVIRISTLIKPGEQIDLGDRKLELVSLPGHSDTSVALIDDEKKLCFGGDFIFPSGGYSKVHLGPLMPGASIKDYLTSAKYIVGRTPGYTFLSGHSTEQIPFKYVESLEQTLEGIVDGSIKGTFVFPLLQFTISTDEQMPLVFHTWGNTNY